MSANDSQRRSLSTAEARKARERSLALGEMPRTYSRLQRIFGPAGPNALKLQEVVARIKCSAEAYSLPQIETQLRLLAEHAPEYLTLKPYGACGTPAVWINRRANGNELMARLRQLAAARLQAGASPAR